MSWWSFGKNPIERQVDAVFRASESRLTNQYLRDHEKELNADRKKNPLGNPDNYETVRQARTFATGNPEPPRHDQMNLGDYLDAFQNTTGLVTGIGVPGSMPGYNLPTTYGEGARQKISQVTGGLIDITGADDAPKPPPYWDGDMLKYAFYAAIGVLGLYAASSVKSQVDNLRMENRSFPPSM